MLASARDRTQWMRGRWGLMVHWLYPQIASRVGGPAPGFDAAVDAFDLDGFLADFTATGADWMMFTIGQNTGYYVGPNAVLDRLVGSGHASRRDLIGEMAVGLKRLGKRFIPYLPSEVAAQSDEVRNGFAWDPADQSEFQRRYTDFLREYSGRLGKDLDAWWFDGCYEWDLFSNKTYDWPLWLGAARAGNPDAPVAFNDGSFYVRKQEPITPYQDYLSGEIGWLENGRIRLGQETEREGPGTLVLPAGPFVPGTHCQWHGLLPIDCFWMYGGGPMDPPRYADAELDSFVKSSLAVGGAVTLNVGIYREGRLAEETVGQLARLSSGWNDVPLCLPDAPVLGRALVRSLTPGKARRVLGVRLLSHGNVAFDQGEDGLKISGRRSLRPQGRRASPSSRSDAALTQRGGAGRASPALSRLWTATPAEEDLE